jgi:hypothetical protein
MPTAFSEVMWILKMREPSMRRLAEPEHTCGA